MLITYFIINKILRVSMCNEYAAIVIEMQQYDNKLYNQK